MRPLTIPLDLPLNFQSAQDLSLDQSHILFNTDRMLLKRLKNGYEIRQLDTESFNNIQGPLREKIFQDTHELFYPPELYSAQEIQKRTVLRKNMGTPFRLNLGLYYKNKMVGWTWGFQESVETFYMVNSAVLPKHRNKGLYSQLLAVTLQQAIDAGFQEIYGRHQITNNSILIAKLKAGFQITHFEVNDRFGILVLLTYFPKPIRRKVLNYRAGQILPDAELRKLGKF